MNTTERTLTLESSPSNSLGRATALTANSFKFSPPSGSGDGKGTSFVRQNEEDEEEDSGNQSFNNTEVQLNLNGTDNDDGSVLEEDAAASSVTSQMPDRYGFLGGDQFTNELEPQLPPEVVREREIKWLQMLSRWDHFMKKEFKIVRRRCRKGIPRSVRGRAWFYLCGAAYLARQNPTTFNDLLAKESSPQCIEDIRKDVHRQFPMHELFAESGPGQEGLFRVLKAYSNLNMDDGYCQAHAPIAATLLMHMPDEDAFWCMVAICGKYLKGYYKPGMDALKLDGDILFGLLKRISPAACKHMKKQSIDPVLYMTEWFLCAFTRSLPWPSVLRVWDMFLCEGIKILFRTALVILKYTVGQSEVLKKCPSMYETLTVLKSIPNFVTDERFLVYQILRLNVTDDNMRKEHSKQLIKRRKLAKKQAQQQQR